MTVSDSPGCFIGRNTPYLKSPLPVSPLVPPLPLCGMMYVQSSTLCHRWWKQDFWGHVAVWKRILQDSANRSVMCETWSLRYKHAENDLEMTQIWIFIDFRICFKCWRRRRWHFKDFDKIADVFFFFSRPNDTMRRRRVSGCDREEKTFHMKTQYLKHASLHLPARFWLLPSVWFSAGCVRLFLCLYETQQ